MVGKVIKGRRDRIVLSTKGGLTGHHRDPKREPVYDTPLGVYGMLKLPLRWGEA